MTLILTANDTGPALTGTVNANLTGATIAIHVKTPDATVINRAGTVTDATGGAWSLAWIAGDLDQVGTHYVEAQVTFSSGVIQTFGPVGFKVRAELA